MKHLTSFLLVFALCAALGLYAAYISLGGRSLVDWRSLEDGAR